MRPRLSALILMLLLVSMGPATSAYTTVESSGGNELLFPVPDDRCRSFNDCPDELEGISYDDYRIGPSLEDSGDAFYVLASSAHVGYLVTYREVVTWDVCMFDSDEVLIECNVHSGERLYVDYVEEGTEYMRITLRSGLYVGYGLDVYQE